MIQELRIVEKNSLSTETIERYAFCVYLVTQGSLSLFFTAESSNIQQLGPRSLGEGLKSGAPKC